MDTKELIEKIKGYNPLKWEPTGLSPTEICAIIRRLEEYEKLEKSVNCIKILSSNEE